MGFEPFERQQSKPAGEDGPVLLVGHDVDTVPVANLVKLKTMPEIRHAMWPPISVRSLAPASPSSNRRSASALKVRAASDCGGSSR